MLFASDPTILLPPIPFLPFPSPQTRTFLACHVSTGCSLPIDSPSPDSASSLSVDSVANCLKNQSLREQDNGNINNENKNENVKLSLQDLNWDHSFVRELPGDHRSGSIPRQVLHACYTKVLPSAEVENPKLVAWSNSVAHLLDLDPKEVPYA